MTDELVNSVTVSGRLVERPDFSETEAGKPLARFWLSHGNNQVQCFAAGVMADNLLKFGAAGVEVLGHGHLEWFRDDPQPYVQLDRLAFVNPKEVASILGWDLQ